MVSKHITLTDTVAEAIGETIAQGRYKDTSAALNEAAWHFFVKPKQEEAKKSKHASGPASVAKPVESDKAAEGKRP